MDWYNQPCKLLTRQIAMLQGLKDLLSATILLLVATAARKASAWAVAFEFNCISGYALEDWLVEDPGGEDVKCGLC